PEARYAGRMRSSWIPVLLLVSACGGSTEVGTSSSGSGGNGSSGSSGSTGAGGSTQPPDGGADGPNDAAPPLDGSAPDPGSVLCDGLPCASLDHYCCDDSMLGTEKCVSDTVSACGGFR